MDISLYLLSHWLKYIQFPKDNAHSSVWKQKVLKHLKKYKITFFFLQIWNLQKF